MVSSDHRCSRPHSNSPSAHPQTPAAVSGVLPAGGSKQSDTRERWRHHYRVCDMHAGEEEEMGHLLLAVSSGAVCGGTWAVMAQLGWGPWPTWYAAGLTAFAIRLVYGSTPIWRRWGK